MFAAFVILWLLGCTFFYLTWPKPAEDSDFNADEAAFAIIFWPVIMIFLVVMLGLEKAFGDKRDGS